MRDKTVAILESRLGEQFCALISKRGGRPFHAPALAEVPDLDLARIATLVPELESQSAQFAVFQTGVGTRALFDATDTLALTDRLLALLATATVVVRGPKPTAALRARKIRIDLSAKAPFTTHEVLDAMQPLPVAEARVLVQRHGAPNVELDQALQARGAQVIEIPMYRWSLPQDTRPLSALIDALGQNRIDAVAFTNAEQVRNLFTVAEQQGHAEALKASLNRTLVASIGPVCSAALREFGVRWEVEASPPKLGELLAALEKALAP
ncbi:MAG: uroporphyrinogen-III synthase [Burkholderiaceae bacterium]|nr:uroporphyrinogen-III synthase [Burkholderiaceae bacterium]MDH3460186.1 uroporphyrinogen-III synthase [Burkholderiaceae bacterium]